MVEIYRGWARLTATEVGQGRPRPRTQTVGEIATVGEGETMRVKRKR